MVMTLSRCFLTALVVTLLSFKVACNFQQEVVVGDGEFEGRRNLTHDEELFGHAWMYGMQHQRQQQTFEQRQRGLANLPQVSKVMGKNDASFGSAIGMSGNTFVVGAVKENSYAGTAYVYNIVSGTFIYSLAQRLSTGRGGGYFSQSVAISSSTIVVGAPNDGDAGMVYVFTNVGVAFSQSQSLSLSGAVWSYFGWSVALFSSTLVVGANTDPGGGAVYVYAITGTTGYSQSQRIASGVASGNFGRAVALSSSLILVGAPFESSQAGAAYVFLLTGAAYSQRQRLASSTTGGWFGYSVAVSNTTLVVGAYYEQVTNGAVYVYLLKGATYSQYQRLASGLGLGQFGWSVAVTSSALVIGANLETNAIAGRSRKGAVYLYLLVGTSYSLQQKIVPGAHFSIGRFGSSVAENELGQVAVGDYYGGDDATGMQGEAFVFGTGTISPSPAPTAVPSPVPTPTPSAVPTTARPSPEPSPEPTPQPSPVPSPFPTQPSPNPTRKPSALPSPAPTFVLPGERMIQRFVGTLTLTHYSKPQCAGDITYTEKVSLATCLPAWSKHQPQLVNTYFRYSVKVGVRNPMTISVARIRYADAACTVYLYDKQQQHSKVTKHVSNGCDAVSSSSSSTRYSFA